MDFVGHFPKMFLNDICVSLILAQSSFISAISRTHVSVFLIGNVQILDPIMPDYNGLLSQ